MTEGDLAKFIDQVNATAPVVFTPDPKEVVKLRNIGYKGVIFIEPSEDETWWNDRGF